jgi:hypothetical protein
MDWVSLVSRAMEIHISLLPSRGDFGPTNFAHLKWKEMSQFEQMCQTKISNSYDCTISKACQSHAFKVRSTYQVEQLGGQARPRWFHLLLCLTCTKAQKSLLVVNFLGTLGCVPPTVECNNLPWVDISHVWDALDTAKADFNSTSQKLKYWTITKLPKIPSLIQTHDPWSCHHFLRFDSRCGGPERTGEWWFPW